MKLATIAFRNIARNTRRSVLSGSAIAIAGMSMVMLFAIMRGMTDDWRSNIVKYYTGDVRVRAIAFDENEDLLPLAESVRDLDATLARLETMHGVAALSPRISFPALVYRNDHTYRAQGVGIDFTRESAYSDLDAIVAEGALPSNDAREVALGVALAEELGVGVGASLTLVTQTRNRSPNGMTFRVVGLLRYPVPALNSTVFAAPLAAVQRLLQMPGEATEILIRLDRGASAIPTAAAMTADFAASDRAELHALALEQTGLVYSFIDLIYAAFAVMAVIFFALASTVIVNTTMMTIYERTKEIGTMAALGMKGSQIVRLFFLEACFIGALGSFAGTILGILGTIPLSIVGLDLTDAMSGVSFEVTPKIMPVLDPLMTFVVFAVGVVVASLTSFVPSTRAARIEPVRALKAL